MSKSEDGSTTALAFSDVSAVRGGRVIWSQATFEIPAGGIYAVIGTNGSGKTTLLQMILGLIPSEGSLRVFGEAPGAERDRIGYVPQHYAEISGGAIRARDAVLLGLTGRRWAFSPTSASDRRRVDDALRAVNAESFADSRLASLSGGQRQRVAIAEALVSQPDMVILDEPLASLDLRSQHEIVSLLTKIQQEMSVTILVVAHDLNPFLPVLSGAIYLLDGHAHYAATDDVIDEDLLTHLYGTRVQVLRTPQGDLYTRSV
ncbi:MULTISPECIES: metal ABC transporter ATP-binding protein [unclassified Gordonia (in: high G+C Gram-positive bacteria)]|uniref:metal ABC transporter ATP-binding protein n=1 Tax=unclassified Gordonia (in: high G+C Gram-positive bacteria) TaxID=2657482 RepID=UPI001F100216|nr:ATP-binding cassette domain-containing protein [Gordonia sp. ABSL49_1]MCH5642332.1 ATP-binding cassette domain-containing protein [Gordonia sp. ABSL49_1]